MSGLPFPITAFFAGLVSFLSPCVLPLVPGYVSMISGVGVEELKTQQAQLMRRVMLNSIEFIIVFSVVFIALGAAATEVGQVLGIYKHTLARVAGVVIILFGLHLTGIFKIKALYTDARLHNVKGGSTPVGRRKRAYSTFSPVGSVAVRRPTVLSALCDEFEFAMLNTSKNRPIS